jgi:peptide/nickel transport system permease protein
MSGVDLVAPPLQPVQRRGRGALLRMLRSPSLVAGLLLALGPLAAALVAQHFIDRSGLGIFSTDPRLHPSASHLLGTDGSGRDLLTSMVYGLPPTLEIGLIAGLVGVVVGTVLGILAGYLGGVADAVIRTVTDVLLGIPPFALLVVTAALVGTLSLRWLAVVIALFSWPLPARAMRSQILALREQGFVVMSRLSNRSAPAIMFFEILPNLFAYVSATFVGMVSSALLIAVGLQLLSLGPANVSTLGLTLQTALSNGALSEGLWWWWLPPTVALVMLFIGLFLISLAVDQIANPRVGRRNARG